MSGHFESFEGTLEECKQWWRKRGATEFYDEHGLRGASRYTAVVDGIHYKGAIMHYPRTRGAKASRWVNS